ncbi:reverse transcriptase domain-containing protein [Tanacetum coccineum]
MPRFAPTIRNLLMNKEKLLELAKIPLNENCSAMLLKKLPEKLGDPGKFLIPCNFPGMDVCHALADLGASINLMPLSFWKKLSLPELTPTRMTLELADRSITHPKGLAEDVYVKVGKFHFPTDFVVVDFEADPRVPLILGRSFLRTGRALIDVYGEEITLRVDNEAVTFNLDQTTRYSSTNDKSVNRIDIIDAVCEEYAPELLGFSNNDSSGGNPTPTSEPLTSEFILEEIEAYLKDDSISPEIDHADCDPEGDICLIEKLLNNDPFQLPPMDLKQSEVTKAKSSIEEPPELELKDLPSHLEYAYLEENDKLPVIIAKGLKDDEKEALLKVLKSHKRAIAWKITDIKGIDPRFCTHKILMEDDYKPTVQSQRRVNPKIHKVSPVHCVPKKGGITVVANEENELIPTRLVTGWRVCIDYRKLNEATRKDHFLLPFIDQMLERLAGNKFYYFLDRFSGYFQIPIDPQDQEKTTFTCPYGTFAYPRMPFGLCNAPGTFQRCMMAIFHDMIEKIMEVFMDDFSGFGDSFDSCLSNLEKNAKTSGIEVDHAKVDVIAKLPHPTTVKGVRSFLGHAGFYRRFIQYFSKIAIPMTLLLEKETPFLFSKDCIDAFQTLKKKLTEAPILVVPDWNLTFSTLNVCASDFAIGAILGQRKMKHFQPIHYASKTLTEAQIHYTATEKEMLAVVYAFEKFRPYLVLSKSIVYMDHSALLKSLNKQDAKPRSNHSKEGTVGENRASWSDKLDEALWAFCTAFKTPIGCTPYKLVYGKSCHLPLRVSGIKHIGCETCYFDLNRGTKKLHDSKIRNCIFNVGDRVLLFNSRLKIFSGKLKTRWSGPFTITKVFPYGTIELSQPDGPNFKVNGHRVKHYFGGDLPPKAKRSWKFLRRYEKIELSNVLDAKQGLLENLKSSFLIYEKPGDVLKLGSVSPVPSLLWGCQKPGHLAARLGCAETKVATWDDLAFKLIILGWNVRILQITQENGQKPDKHGHENGKECTRAGDLIAEIDLFADTGFVSAVGGSFWVVSVPIKIKNRSYKTLLVRLSKLSTVIVKLLSELAASVLWAANVVTMVFATSSITSCGGDGRSMILYCRRSIVEDCKMARETKRLCGEVVVVVEERAQFLQELDSLP